MRPSTRRALILGIAVFLAGCASTTATETPVASALGTALVVKQTTPQIVYEVHVSNPAEVTLTLETLARVTEIKMFECSQTTDIANGQPCIIEGVLQPPDPDSHGTLSLLVEPTGQYRGTSERRIVQVRTDASGHIDF